MPKHEKVMLFTDGGSRGNPGHAGIGVVIKNSAGEVIAEHGEYIGETTNNQAEYNALIRGLDMASEHSDEVDVFMDSQLIVRQMTGVYKMKEPSLFPLQKEVFLHQKKFKHVSFHHIPREQNYEADKLVNIAIDRATKG